LVSILRTDRMLASWVPENADRIPLGSSIRIPELAATLRTFGRQGAAPFYRGAIARAIVRAVAARGGVITMDDLARYRVRDREPLSADRFGYRFVTAPPPSAGGFTILHSLALMERWQPEGGWREGAAFRHALSQSWSGAFIDRAAYLGDPDHAEIPLEELLSEGRLTRRAALFDPLRMRSADEWTLPLEPTEQHRSEPPSGTGTSHLCVVDAEGNIAAITTTINLQFGARVSAAGIVLNDEMDDFAREVGAANYFGLPGGAANLPAPGRRPISSMSPTIVFSQERPVLCIGASGGSRIITGTEQVMLLSLLLGEPIDDAVRRPRIHHQGRPETTLYERDFHRETLAGLWGRGHELHETSTVGNVQGIRIEYRDDGSRTLHAASDPRKDGAPRGR
jgi:gamma-glutamyltranspeptidase/glutathione hydrolase